MAMKVLCAAHSTCKYCPPDGCPSHAKPHIHTSECDTPCGSTNGPVCEVIDEGWKAVTIRLPEPPFYGVLIRAEIRDEKDE